MVDLEQGVNVESPAIVVMGVSGCGKTVVGRALAEKLGRLFIEGDDFHPAANVGLMKSGRPLTDENRWEWLDAIGKRLAEIAGEGGKSVAACSALKRKYRERLDAACPGILFVYLELDRETAYARVSGRKGHYMPASLVDSQFDTLEPPQAGERAVTIDARPPVAAVVDAALAAVRSKT